MADDDHGPLFVSFHAIMQLTLESCPPFRINGGWMGEWEVLNAGGGLDH